MSDYPFDWFKYLSDSACFYSLTLQIHKKSMSIENAVSNNDNIDCFSASKVENNV